MAALEESAVYSIPLTATTPPDSAARSVGPPKDTEKLPDSNIPKPPTEIIGTLVSFEDDVDPSNPKNWSSGKKILTTSVMAYATFVTTWASSVYSPAVEFIVIEFHVSTEVANLGTSFYVLGFSAGPLIWAPFSEIQGRRLPMLLSTLGFALFMIAVATGRDIQTILICRFWAGLFASAPLALGGAVISDMFEFARRGTAVAYFVSMVFLGPIIAPVVGAFISENQHVGWRWTEYLTAIMAFVELLLEAFPLQETYAPLILARKAFQKRLKEKDMSFYAPHERISIDLHKMLDQNLTRPLHLLTSEPIVLLVSIYMAFVYGLLYGLLLAYPYVFVTLRRWSLGVGMLPYLGVSIGILAGSAAVTAVQPWINRRTVANHGIPIPENRLPVTILGGFVFTIGLFWFAWGGNNTSIHWIVPTLAGVPIGFGFITIFITLLNYIVDSYLTFSASAIAATTVLRSLCASAFPLFTTQMLKKLGVGWAGSMLAFIALALVPVPVLFYIFGSRIRQRSEWAPTKRR